jgi:hypothetical protein
MRDIELPSLDHERVRGPAPAHRQPPYTQRLEDRQFLEMEQSFRPSGGLVSGDELVRHLRRHHEQPISTLARWIVERQVVSLSWQGQTLLPMFQFEPSDMGMNPAVAASVRELKDIFDDWDLALWFARPNIWLFDRAPVQLIVSDPLAVRNAARADRFIALG